MNIFSYARKFNFSLILWDEAEAENEVTRWALFHDCCDSEPVMFLDTSYSDEYQIRSIWAGMELNDQTITTDQLKTWISSHSNLQ